MMRYLLAIYSFSTYSRKNSVCIVFVTLVHILLKMKSKRDLEDHLKLCYFEIVILVGNMDASRHFFFQK